MIEEKELKELLNEYSLNRISKLKCIPLSSLRYIAKKYGLKSKFKQMGQEGYKPVKWGKSKEQKNSRHIKIKYLPIEEINEKFKNGATQLEIAKEYGVDRSFVQWGFKNKYFNPIQKESKKMMAEKHHYKFTPEDKKKISERMTKYFADHPEKFPWRNKAHFKSVPCEKFKEWLTSQGIIFIEEYPALKDIGRNYCIDIAFPDKKLGIEINGTQHYNSDGSLKPYYAERTKIFEENGWKLLQIPYTLCYKLEEIKNDVLNFIENGKKKLEFDYTNYKIKIYIYPSDEELKKLVLSKPLSKLAIDLKIHVASLSRHCISHKIALPPKGYWGRKTKNPIGSDDKTFVD
jgi:hypothetical protein